MKIFEIQVINGEETEIFNLPIFDEANGDTFMYVSNRDKSWSLTTFMKMEEHTRLSKEDLEKVKDLIRGQQMVVNL